MTDAQRSAVYSAEDQWAAAVDRGGTMDFHGSTITLPVQRRFGGLVELGEYVGEVCDRHGMTTPMVRHRRGGSRAHYEQAGVIAIPTDEPWAMRESVVLHELAHHRVALRQPGLGEGTPPELDHGPAFTAAMLDLVDAELGPEAALVLRTAYQSNLVAIDVVD